MPALILKPNLIFVSDGRFFTPAGVTAAIDLALALIEADHGRELAVSVPRELIVYLKRSGGQDQYSTRLQLQARSGGRLAALPAWIAANLTGVPTVAAIAEQAHPSARQRRRRFAGVGCRTCHALPNNRLSQFTAALH